MSTVSGLPAHVLLVHFIVVLAPLTAVLEIMCALWRAARRHLVWLGAVLAVVCLILTPLTTDAGEWLEHHVDVTPAIRTHTELGDTMIYVSVALVIAAILLVMVHLRESRGRALNNAAVLAISALVVIVGIGTVVQVYRIGDSGARSAWGDTVSGK
ncbi:DUF2231 domain-containing protein [Gordonia sp. CPCC 205515]|uniref:DUF2231 domain-containing protein n=1 Tax=Gordonia sp. CPCC 205515 TaxID=3140791 RepID=UPI003AF373A4